ncbi:MAG: hypothetical protein UW38_C0001G0167 [Candidatus Saccharibacteria bacterium GW2011_GWC2_44_17]|nr:MAG: hypothetical protein UW38_C0001G0167 [Candidatus Saccharibacteria bacterium GW2011_GWC2_44_17]MBH1956282.1 hypothetical protein [Candidatus Saccharibacteria bacterium]OGL23406.1 MAG: hypothetical protein A2791_00990 [Candidatus Saccharibacteria bacterium RIFCSPHIGHO2_01_FULL_46_30]OGL33954.1 MAG: hypothetical protein A3E20_05050 [Candidatus Saccharibacteria bacterium RIFCSPHIGHO2_12_FULL_47_16]MBH1972670.1 hypothetical protein [Candidatus Saccharibacteria bacterium]
MESHKSSLPPLTIEYPDGEMYIDRPVTAEQASSLFRVCMQSLPYNPTIRNPYPVHLGGMERVHQLKLEAARHNVSMQYVKSDGNYGIME